MSSCSSSVYKAPMEDLASSRTSRLVAYSDSEEEEEVMVMVDEEDEETRRKKLHSIFKENFSVQTIEEAIRVCGARAPEEELVDFMLALPHAASPPESSLDTEMPGSLPNGTCSNGGRATPPPNSSVPANSSADSETRIEEEVELRSMGFSSEQVSAALESCGNGASLETKIAFIFAMEGEDEEEEPVLEVLTKFGYPEDMALKAIEACGCEDVDVLVDYMDAHSDVQDANSNGQDTSSVSEEDDDDVDGLAQDYARVMQHTSTKKKKKRRRSGSFSLSGIKNEPVENMGTLRGFSLPNEHAILRCLSSEQKMQPFFYFENVRSMPRGEWNRIKSFLFDIDPEFVCASHFSVTRRPRGYVHNLPINGRTQALPLPPMTIREFFPKTAKFIPEWDTRTKLNTIVTQSGMTFAAKVRAYLKTHPSPSEDKIKEIMLVIKKWNLVWTGHDHCSPLEPHEIERALGFDENHTRGLCVSERLKALGNSFQTDVVAYHLSPLKHLFPDGVRVLSLFAGIGGAEVALHKAGVILKFVVSVEIRQDNSSVLERWWRSSGQTGEHVVLHDVQDLTRAKLRELMKQGGGPFDLIIGGSPCNNLSGSNRTSRTGLDGDKSALFYEFPRIYNVLRGLGSQL